jgi:hypothetical protein
VPVAPAKENTMNDTTKDTAAALVAIKRLYTGSNDLDDLTPSDIDLIDKVIEEGMLGLRLRWRELERVVEHADELDADDYEISKAIATHAVDWWFSNHATKAYTAEFTVTYTRRVTVEFTCKPGQEDDVAESIKDQLDNISADESVSYSNIGIEDGEIADISDEGTEHYETDIEGCSEM